MSDFKKPFLWNVLDPNDPYDIRQSLIARMPGDSKRFMGDHLQLVCLLQAVQIQRLIEYLNDYKLKYKEVERNQFDRHSMQTQIKELLEMNADSEILKIEVNKLREFIRRLSEELQNEKKQNRTIDQGLQIKYEQALNKLELMVVEKGEMGRKITDLERNLESWRQRYQALDRTRQIELEQAKGEVERQYMLDREIKELNSKLIIERNQYESSIKYQKELLETRDQEINTFHLQLSETNRSMSIKQSQLLKTQESRQYKYKQQIDFLNNRLMTESMKYQEITIKYQTLLTQHEQQNKEYQDVGRIRRKNEEEIELLNKSLQKLQSKLNERVGVDGRLEQAENKIALLSQEITRLQYMNGNKVKQLDEIGERNKKIGYQYELLRREYLVATTRIADLEKSQFNSQDLNSNIIKLTQDNAVLRGEISYNEQTIRRLTADQQRMHPELIEVRRQLSIFSDQNIKFRNKVHELSSALDESSKSQTNTSELEKRIRLLENQRDYAVRQSSQLNRTLNQLQNEITNSEQYQRRFMELKSVLESERKRSTVEKDTYQQRMRAMTDSHDEQLKAIQGQLEYSRRYVDESELLKSNYSRVLDERDKLNEMAHELQERLRSFGGEQRIVRFNEEIEKLSRKLREKNDELIEYQRRLKELEQFRGKYYESISQIDTLRKKIQLLEPVHNKQHQHKIASLTKQIQSLRKQLNSQDFKSKIIDYEKRVTLFSEQIDRLNEKNHLLRDENDNWREKYNTVVDERDQLDEIAHELQDKLRKVSESNEEIMELRRKGLGYEERIVMLMNELERLRGGEGNYQNSISSLTIEIDRLKHVIREQSLAQTNNEKKLTTMSQEINRLNYVLQQKVHECSMYEKDIEKMKNMIEISRTQEDESVRLGESNRMLRGQIKELEEEIRASTVGLHSLKGENDGLRRKIGEIQFEIKRRKEIQIERDQWKRQAEQRSTELTSTNDRVRALILEMDKLSLQLKSKEAVTLQINRLTSEFTHKISFLTQDNDRLKSLYDESARKNTALQLSIHKLTHQIDTMNIKLRETDGYAAREDRYRLQIEKLNQSVIVKESEIAGLQKSMTQLEMTRQKTVRLGEQLERSKGKNGELMIIVTELERKLLGSESDVESYKTRLQFFEDQIKRLKEIETRQSNAIQEKNHIISSLNDQISQYKIRLTKINSEWGSKVSLIEKDKRTLQHSNENLQRLYEDSKIQIKKLEDERVSLRGQLANISNKDTEYREQIVMLEQRIVSYQSRIGEANRDNDTLRRKVENLEYQVQDSKRRLGTAMEDKGELERLKMRIREVEIEKEGSFSRLISIGNEVQRLNQVLKTKVQDVDLSNKKLMLLNIELNDSRIKLSQLTGDNEGLRLTISDLNIRLQSQNSNRNLKIELEQKNNKLLGYENKLALLSQEIERLEQVKRSSSQRIHILEMKLGETEKSVILHEEKLIALTRELERLNGVLKNKLELDQEILYLQNENDKLQKTLRIKLESEANVAMYLEEIQRLNNTLQIKVRESKEMESSRLLHQNNDAKIASYSIEIERLNKELKFKVDENRELRQKIVEMNRESDELRGRENRAVRDYEQARKKYLETEEKLPRLNAEFENLNRVLISQKHQINSLKQENYNLKVQLSNGSSQSLQQKNNMLAEEIKRLTRIIQERDSEIAELRLRFVDDNALEKRIKEHLALFVVLFAEIESLRKRLKDKEKEVTDVRRSSLANYIVNNNNQQ